MCMRGDRILPHSLYESLRCMYLLHFYTFFLANFHSSIFFIAKKWLCCPTIADNRQIRTLYAEYFPFKVCIFFSTSLALSYFLLQLLGHVWVFVHGGKLIAVSQAKPNDNSHPRRLEEPWNFRLKKQNIGLFITHECNQKHFAQK